MYLKKLQIMISLPTDGRLWVSTRSDSSPNAKDAVREFMNASSTCNKVMNVRKVSHLQLKIDYGIDYLCSQESDGLSSVSFCLLGLLKIHEVMEFVPLNV
jgi:hypothetical protein